LYKPGSWLANTVASGAVTALYAFAGLERLMSSLNGKAKENRGDAGNDC